MIVRLFKRFIRGWEWGGLPFTLSRSFAAILGEKTTTHGPIRTVSASLSDYPDLAGWGFAQSGTGVRRKHRQGSWQQGVFAHSSNLCRSTLSTGVASACWDSPGDCSRRRSSLTHPLSQEAEERSRAAQTDLALRHALHEFLPDGVEDGLVYLVEGMPPSQKLLIV